jgi:hypothetical protein
MRHDVTGEGKQARELYISDAQRRMVSSCCNRAQVFDTPSYLTPRTTNGRLITFPSSAQLLQIDSYDLERLALFLSQQTPSLGP